MRPTWFGLPAPAHCTRARVVEPPIAVGRAARRGSVGSAHARQQHTTCLHSCATPLCPRPSLGRALLRRAALQRAIALQRSCTPAPPSRPRRSYHATMPLASCHYQTPHRRRRHLRVGPPVRRQPPCASRGIHTSSGFPLPPSPFPFSPSPCHCHCPRSADGAHLGAEAEADRPQVVLQAGAPHPRSQGP